MHRTVLSDFVIADAMLRVEPDLVQPGRAAARA